MKTLILQACEQSYNKLLDISKINKQYYADKHGYDLLSLEINWNSVKPAVWMIPTVICKILCDKQYNDYDYIFWSDVDSLIMNFDIRLEDIIMQGQCCDLITNLWNFESEYNYTNLNGNIDIIPGKSVWFMICTGNWLIKNNEWNRRFFNTLCNDPRFLRKELATNPMGDEFAFTVYYLSQPEIRKHFYFLPIETFLTVGEKNNVLHETAKVPFYKEKDFIIHYPHLPLIEREEAMKAICHY